ncbi:hypothetical protein HHK36_010422 [Tetracentron sinense]|uniref:Uncharacterized protein n=1 Tax=Tetracentron sinense TaxID=13715 RepID=A0A834ZE87_TETSI|nr:hypothetical protein HHK36_010422 [Tetracentron sinense]
MAAYPLNTRSPYHARSISLPSRSHPLTLRVEEQLHRLRASEATASSSSICRTLDGLKELYDSVGDLLQLPLTQQALAPQRHEKWIDEVLDGSVMLLDVCGITRDVLLQMKESVHGLQSSLRRKKYAEFGLEHDVSAYMACRRKVKKTIRKCLGDWKRTQNKRAFSSVLDKDGGLVAMASVLREVEAITFTVFESLLSFVYGPKAQSKQSGWSLVSKLMHTKRVACDGEVVDICEMDRVDVTLCSLIHHKSQKGTSVLNIQNVQKQLEVLELSIHGLEDGVESIFRAGGGLMQLGKMAASLAIPKSPCHARSISLPSRSHPLTLSIEEQLHRLRASEATSSLSVPSSICRKLSALDDLYEHVDDMLHLPLIQRVLSHYPHEKWVDEVLDGSLRLLEVCGTSRDFLLQMKECVQDLESSLSRKRVGEFGLANEVQAYIISRKKASKGIRKCFENLKRMESKCAFSNSLLDKDDYGLVAMVSVLREVEAITLSVLKSILSFESSPKTRSKPSGWYLVSKFIQTKRVACEGEGEDVGEMEKLDVALCALLNRQKSCKDIGVVQNAQKRLEALELSIQSLEEGVECMFRRLIRTRVSLLNILNQ